MSRRTFAIVVAVAMLLHAGLALAFASRTPYRTAGFLLGQRDPATGGPQNTLDVGAPDERQHANYVVRLARGEGFPVFDPKALDLYESYQSHQPPLFYLAAAALTGQRAEPTPADALRDRWPNALFGALVVAGAAAVGAWGSGRRTFGAGMALTVAPWPMLAALSGAVSNDPLLIAGVTWGLALLLRMANESWTVKGAAAFGIVAGLALLTKTTALVLLPLAVAAWAFTPRERRSLPAFLVAVALPLLLASPWLVRNQNLYGDPFAMRAFNEAFVGSAQKSQIVEAIRLMTPGVPAETSYWVNWVLWWTGRSLIGTFGYMDVWLNESGLANTRTNSNALYAALLVAGSVAALAALALWRRPGLPDAARRFARISFVLALLVGVLFVSFNARYFQAQGRYLLPSVAPLAATLVAGLGAIFRGRWLAAGATIGAILLAVSLFAIARLPAEFARRITPLPVIGADAR